MNDGALPRALPPRHYPASWRSAEGVQRAVRLVSVVAVEGARGPAAVLRRTWRLAVLLGVAGGAGGCGPADDPPETCTTTPVTPVDCVAAPGVVLRAEVRGSAGACTACDAGDPLHFVAIAENPCGADFDLTGPTPCLVYGWSIASVDPDLDLDFGEFQDCAAMTTTFVVPAMSALEMEAGAFAPGVALEPGDYRLRVTWFEAFSDTRFDICFTVQ